MRRSPVRWTEADLKKAGAEISKMARAPMTCMPSKYGNRRAYWQGQVFDSQHELEIFQTLELERLAGKFRAVVRQVSFRLPGCNRRIRVDFMLVLPDMSIRWIDAKGIVTEAWALKQAQIQQAFGLKIETV